MTKAAAPDLGEFAAENAVRKGEPCSVSVVLAKLDEERCGQLRAALESDHITHAAVARVLTRWGYKTLAQTIGRHRRGLCSCD